jgi:hypothetical protein
MSPSQTVTLASPGPTLSVAAVPGGFTSLWVIMSGIQSSAAATSDQMLIRFNGDAGASHYGGGPATSPLNPMTGFNNAIIVTMPGTSAGISTSGQCELLISNYNQTTANIGFMLKVSGRTGNAGTAADFAAPSAQGLWTGNTSVLTAIAATWVTGPNFVAGATMNVYGIT